MLANRFLGLAELNPEIRGCRNRQIDPLLLRRARDISSEII
jgi:hypothetical protein